MLHLNFIYFMYTTITLYSVHINFTNTPQYCLIQRQHGKANVDVITRLLMSYSSNDAHTKLIPITLFIIALALLTYTCGQSLRSQNFDYLNPVSHKRHIYTPQFLLQMTQLSKGFFDKMKTFFNVWNV